MHVQVISTEDLGDRSYVAHDGTSAVVVDPQRDVDRVEKVLADLGVRCAMVVETHMHNDYVTGGYDLAMRNLQVASPLQQERGVYYVTGNRAHQGGVESVAIAMQAASNSVRVWLLHEGREQVLEEQRNAFAWPTDVQTLITNNHHNPARR